ncbi:hypothetical protein AX15_005006 [Amanita polypyramis BW_CC]|nr:hypothetical protein AX15_005006 [Amanita polypyramis BW_CC]
MQSTTATVTAAAKEVLSSLTATDKIRDLQRDIVDAKPDSPLTTDHGVRISDTDNWLKVSDGRDHGPSLLEDQIAREKIHRFDHERIPERVVHARGTGAHGYFKVFDDRASKYTVAPVLFDPSRTTPVFVRFSTVQGSRGSADTVRDVRGFAIKFYTQEGIWDLVGNNIPVFFIQDAIKFPDIIHAVKPEPHNEIPQGQSAHNNFWDFAGLQTETAHMVMWVMSDRGIPRSFRMMQGFGVNTFTLLNGKGERYFVKFHLIPELGVHSLVWDEALKLSGQDPDFHRKDLNEAIENGCPPKWTFAIQVLEEDRQHDFDFDVLDATKVWPEELVPLQPIGELVLNRTVNEFFPEVEQVAFCTSHVVPGIGFSDDPLLQGRNFSYFDTQITRLGVNWEQIPINRPTCPVLNHQRDGAKQHRIVPGSINYWPNRRNVGRPASISEGAYFECQQKVGGMKQRIRGVKFQEHFNQAELFYNSLTPYEREHLKSAIAFELSHCDDKQVHETYIKILNEISLEMADFVSFKVGGVVSESAERECHKKSSPTLSQAYYAPKSPMIATRRVAILIEDGFNMPEVQTIRTTLASAKVISRLIGPRQGKIFAAGESVGSGEGLVADHHFEGQRSTMFDAVLIPSGEEHANALTKTGRVIHWIREAFGHCKVIGAIGEAVSVVRFALQIPTLELQESTISEDVIVSYGVVTVGSFNSVSAARDILEMAPNTKGFISNFAYEVSKHRCYDRELKGLTKQVAY